MKKCLIVAIFSVLASAALAGWVSENIITTGDVGAGCNLAVDRWGRLHVVFFDKTNEAITYGKRTGTAWSFETIATNVDLSSNIALCLDAFDAPHVVYGNNRAVEVVYATRGATTWTTEKIDSYSTPYVAVAAWPTGPRVAYAYAQGFSTLLKTATKNGSTWTIESIVSSGDGGGCVGLTVDSAGTSHAYYYARESGKQYIKHAVRGASSWTAENVGEGNFCGITEGPDGKTHVSFAKPSGPGVVYAVAGPTAWTTEEVTAATGGPMFTHICLNSAGKVYISYFNLANTNLKIVSKTGTTWKLETVATGGYVGYHHAMALGTDGYPLIVYYNGDNGNLRLAHYEDTNDINVEGFSARRRKGGVDATWSYDGGELAGFNLYRGASEGDKARVNEELIVGAPPLRYVDNAAPATATNYWLEAVPLSGPSETFGPVVVPPVSVGVAFDLHQSYPNPNHGEAVFRFDLERPGKATLSIYDLAGRKLATVTDGYRDAGPHDVRWNGTLAPGMYVYRLDAEGSSAARKMVVTK